MSARCIGYHLDPIKNLKYFEHDDCQKKKKRESSVFWTLIMINTP